MMNEHLLDVTALVEGDYIVQYGVMCPDTTPIPTAAIRVFGDQQWVKCGDAAHELGGITVRRAVHVSYGPWEVVPGD